MSIETEQQIVQKNVRLLVNLFLLKHSPKSLIENGSKMESYSDILFDYCCSLLQRWMCWIIPSYVSIGPDGCADRYAERMERKCKWGIYYKCAKKIPRSDD